MVTEIVIVEVIMMQSDLDGVKDVVGTDDHDDPGRKRREEEDNENENEITTAIMQVKEENHFTLKMYTLP